MPAVVETPLVIVTEGVPGGTVMVTVEEHPVALVVEEQLPPVGGVTVAVL